MQRGIITVLFVLLAATALAVAPRIFNFQGRLTDASGNPVSDGNHDAYLRLYNVPTGGTPLYTTLVGLKTKDGLFSVTTSQFNTIEPSVLADTTVYLGIELLGDPGVELTPRMRLVSAPYALEAQYLEGTFNGKVRTKLLPETATNSQMALLDSAGNEKINLSQRSNLNYIHVYRPNTQTLATIFETSASSTYLAMYPVGGGQATVYLTADNEGNNSVLLPDSSVSANEMQNEPGIAANYNSGVDTIATATLTDVVTVTLNAPTAGFVFVSAKANVYLSGTYGRNFIYAQIDDNPGGSLAEPNWLAIGHESNSYNSDAVYVPFALTRVFSVSAGTHTYRLEARHSGAQQGANALAEVRHSTIQAIFIPTSYGSVNALVSAGEAGQFEQTEAVQVDGETMYKVDLREMEVRAAKAEAEANRLKLQLLEAKLKQAEE